MPDKRQQDRSLGQRVVKEAVGVGMESPMRESILEAVEESEGTPARRRRQLPLAGALLGLGAAFGYMLGTRSEAVLEGEGSITESLEESEIVETAEEATEEMVEEEAEMEAQEGSGGRSRLPRVALVLGLGAAVALLRRRLRSGEEEEWEPIEEFKTATEDVEEVAEEITESEDEGEASEEGEESESEAEDEESEETEEE